MTSFCALQWANVQPGHSPRPLFHLGSTLTEVWLSSVSCNVLTWSPPVQVNQHQRSQSDAVTAAGQQAEVLRLLADDVIQCERSLVRAKLFWLAWSEVWAGGVECSLPTQPRCGLQTAPAEKKNIMQPPCHCVQRKGNHGNRIQRPTTGTDAVWRKCGRLSWVGVRGVCVSVFGKQVWNFVGTSRRSSIINELCQGHRNGYSLLILWTLGVCRQRSGLIQIVSKTSKLRSDNIQNKPGRLTAGEELGLGGDSEVQ